MEAHRSLDDDRVKIRMSTMCSNDQEIESVYSRLGKLDPHQVAIWRAMSPARRLEIAFQAYQFALDTLRLTEQRAHPDLSPDELAWRVTRRMQHNPNLGR
jgi:hypothetical protein